MTPSVAVLAPSPTLTVTVERGDQQGAEIHYHPGGQGVWVARMAALLGADVVLCAVVAGESGRVIKALLDAPGVEVRAVAGHGRSGSYVHDRRHGAREPIAEADGPIWWRHETDELFGIVFTAGLAADVTMLTGPKPASALGQGFYRGIAGDLRLNGRTVIADLTGPALAGALAGGVDVLKISDEELVGEGLAGGAHPAQLVDGMSRLREAGARDVLVSRAEKPALATVGGALYEIEGPRVEARDPRGSGDSMFAALGVALARGRAVLEALPLAAAAGTLNATRRGLGTGSRADIERIAATVRVEELRNASTATIVSDR